MHRRSNLEPALLRAYLRSVRAVHLPGAIVEPLRKYVQGDVKASDLVNRLFGWENEEFGPPVPKVVSDQPEFVGFPAPNAGNGKAIAVDYNEQKLIAEAICKILARPDDMCRLRNGNDRILLLEDAHA